MAQGDPIAAAGPTKNIALVGNPNSGKTTLFNALTGFRQQVGNYPGVTVERKTGVIRHARRGMLLRAVDLPGTYSLNAQSADEAVVLDVILGRDASVPRPDLIVCVVDASNLSRHLFFFSQLLECGIPIVVALNMLDVAEGKGLRLDVEGLSQELGVPVIPVMATTQRGIDALGQAIADRLETPHAGRLTPFPDVIHTELDGLCESVVRAAGGAESYAAGSPRVELLQALLDPGGYHERRLVERCGGEMVAKLAERRRRIATDGESIVELEARIRYAWIEPIVAKVVRRSRSARPSRSELADRVLTHRFLGFVILLLIMAVCFQAIYTWAGPIMDAIDGAFGAAGRLISQILPHGAVQSLVVNGCVAGVGAVLVFLPQILILFLFIAILEDCGYIARAAFLLDRCMGVLGLNGKSFIPLLSSFACAVPGIMATRTIEDRNSRFVTIMIAPLMSCSARLPVYTLLIAAFVPATPLLGGLIGAQAVTLLALYVLGASVAVVAAVILRRTILVGVTPPFLMELPSYKWPTPRTVVQRMYSQGRRFVVNAGTMIFSVSVVVWALGYYPHPPSIAAEYDARRVAVLEASDTTGEDSVIRQHANTVATNSGLAQRLVEVRRLEAGAYLRQSFLGRMGSWIEPVVRPLGWDWRIGTAVIASFPAREVVIATMGTIYNLGGDQDVATAGLRAKLRSATWPDGKPVYNIAVALSLMVFYALCCQCVATLAVMKRETNSWRMATLTFCAMTLMAYLGALATYQIASRVFA